MASSVDAVVTRSDGESRWFVRVAGGQNLPIRRSAIAIANKPHKDLRDGQFNDRRALVSHIPCYILCT